VESSTQDDTAPVSSAGPLDPFQYTETFDIPYTATDATSGVDFVELFYQLDGGGYISYGIFTSSPISFTASGDGFYEFYTVATDSVGNVEAAPASADASTTVDTSAPNPPTMAAEPNYTQGTTNTVNWSDESGSGAVEYYAERATDSGFTADVDSSGWIPGTSYEFTALLDAQIYYYRVKARSASSAESGWSNIESSTQDDAPPSSNVTSIGAYQNTLIFGVPYVASDATSGVVSVELFYQQDGGGYISYGVFTSSPITFAAPGDGFYEFYTVATDSVGNVESAPATPDASTEVDTTTPQDPVMDPEPPYSPGTTNTVSWGPVTMRRSPVSYRAQRATDPDFNFGVESTTWIAETFYEFTGLTDGQIYYYRVLARDAALNESGWSNVVSSTQDTLPPTSTAGPLDPYQGDVTFDVPYTADDATSGIDNVELFYQLDGGGYSSYGTFISSPISFTASGDGFYEFYTVATDSAGLVESAPVSADAGTTVDTVPPGEAVAIAAIPGHKKVEVTWTDPAAADLFTLEIWRGLWHDGSLNSAYPEYDDLPGNSIPTRPLDRDGADASAEWVLLGTVTPGTQAYVDSFIDYARGVYYYEIFPQDSAGSYGAPALANGRATNYWLGDFSGSVVPFDGFYDGYVDDNDLISLKTTYSRSEGHPSYVNEGDVGPTETGSSKSIPLTDNVIDFEDLIIVALNYGMVGPLVAPALPELPETGAYGPLAFRLDVPSSRVGGEMVVRLRMSGNEDQLKGASLILRYDPEALQWIRTVGNPALTSNGVFFTTVSKEPGEVIVDFAALGRGRTIVGSGELAELVFVRKLSADAQITFRNGKVRGVENIRLFAEFEGQILEPGESLPQVTRLLGARPNPFSGSTSIRYDLHEPKQVILRVYDIQGRLVRTLVDRPAEAGRQTAIWDGRDSRGNVAGLGVYFLRLDVGSDRFTSRIVMLR
jgi:hypothetical protein